MKFYVNGKPVEVSGPALDKRLIEFLPANTARVVAVNTAIDVGHPAKPGRLSVAAPWDAKDF